jgi:hypothetical protein
MTNRYVPAPSVRKTGSAQGNPYIPAKPVSGTGNKYVPAPASWSAARKDNKYVPANQALKKSGVANRQTMRLTEENGYRAIDPSATTYSSTNNLTVGPAPLSGVKFFGATGPRYQMAESGLFAYVDMPWLAKYPHHYVGFVETSYIAIKAKVNLPSVSATLVLGNGPECTRVKMPLLFQNSGGGIKDYVVWFAKNVNYPLGSALVANNVEGTNTPKVWWSESDPRFWPWEADDHEIWLADQSIWWGHPLDTDIFNYVEIRTEVQDMFSMLGSPLEIHQVKINLNGDWKLANPYEDNPAYPNYWPSSVSITRRNPLNLVSLIESYGLWRIGNSSNKILRYAVRDLAQSWSPKYFPRIAGWNIDYDDKKTGDWKHSREFWSSDFTSTVIRRSTEIGTPLNGDTYNDHYISGHPGMRDYYFKPRGEWISDREYGTFSRVEYKFLGGFLRPGYYIIGNNNKHSAFFIRWHNPPFIPDALYNRFEYIDGNSADRVRVHTNGYVTSVPMGMAIPPGSFPNSGFIVWYLKHSDTDGFGVLRP